MIFSTPKMANRPTDTTNKIAAVVRMSRRSSIAGAKGNDLSRVPSSLLRVRALIAGVDILEGRGDLDRAVALHLAEVHGELRWVLLVHHDRAARPGEGDGRQGLDHLGRIGRTTLLYRELVEIDRLIFWHREVVWRLKVGAEFLARGVEKFLVLRRVDASHVS